MHLMRGVDRQHVTMRLSNWRRCSFNCCWDQ